MLTFNDLGNILKEETIKIILEETELRIENNLKVKKIEVENYEKFIDGNLIEQLELKIILPKIRSYGISISYGVLLDGEPFKKQTNTWNCYMFSESNENVRWGEEEIINFRKIGKIPYTDVRNILQKMLYDLGFKNVIIPFKNKMKKSEQIKIENTTVIKEESANARI